VGCNIAIMKLFLPFILVTTIYTQTNEKVRHNWEDGAPKLIFYYEGVGFDETLIGKKSFYRSGNLRWKCRYKDNSMHGEYKYYNEDGSVLLEGQFEDGSKSGEWKCFKPRMISTTSIYNTGRQFEDNLNIVNIGFHDNGEISFYSILQQKLFPDQYENEWCSEEETEWFENGNKQKFSQYSVTCKKTYEEAYHENGNIKIKNYYDVFGEPKTMKLYHKNGNISSYWNFKEDYHIRYDEKGNFIKDSRY
tara:strand:+ start:31 stop:774 length:744 start_codon:yes stop_codon:yes gene_type:complete